MAKNIKKKKFQFAGSNNPCGDGTEWDQKQMKCVPSQNPIDPNRIDLQLMGAMNGTSTGFNEGASANGYGEVTNSDVIPLKKDSMRFNPQTRQFEGGPKFNPQTGLFETANLYDDKAGATDSRGTFIPQQQVIGDALDKGFNYDSDGVYRKTETTINNNILGYNDAFKALNVGLDLTKIIGGKIADVNTTKKEKYNLLKARYKQAQYNPYEQGLNNVPAYFQNGGKFKPIIKDDRNIAESTGRVSPLLPYYYSEDGYTEVMKNKFPLKKYKDIDNTETLKELSKPYNYQGTSTYGEDPNVIDTLRYKTLSKLLSDNGSPNIDYNAKTKISHYNPLTNTINISRGEDLVDELSHVKQKNLIGNLISDWVKNPYFSREEQNKQYDIKGSTEYNAHSVIAPKLYEEYGRLSDSIMKNTNSFPLMPTTATGTYQNRGYQNGGSVFPQFDFGAASRDRVSVDNTNKGINKKLTLEEQKKLAAIQHAKDAPTLKQISKEEFNKTASLNDIVHNPMTALAYKMKGLDIPSNFTAGDRNVLDNASDVINPIFYADAVKNTANRLAHPVDTFNRITDNPAAEGLSALMDIGMAVPGLKSLKNLPIVDRLVNSPLPKFTTNLINQQKYKELGLLYAQVAGAEVAPYIKNSPEFIQKAYKDMAYKYASRGFSEPSMSLGRMKIINNIKKNFIGTTKGFDENTKRDLLKLYMYGDESGFNKSDLIPEGLEKYQKRYGDLNVYKMHSYKGNGNPVTVNNEILSNSEKGDKTLFQNEFANPINPSDNVAGHMGWIDKNNNLISQDIWKFTPEDYIDKWSTTNPVMLQDYILSKQVKMMDNAGKPFVLMSKNPIINGKKPIDDFWKQNGWTGPTDEFGLHGMDGFEEIKQNGGAVNNTGYTPGTNTYNNPYNIIPSKNITMKNTPFPVMAYPDGDNPLLMHPGQEYNFPNSKYVTEIPQYKNGGDNQKQDDKSIAAAILNQGNIEGRKLTAKQKKHFKFVLEGKIHLDGHTKDAKAKGTYQNGGLTKLQLEEFANYGNEPGIVSSVSSLRDKLKDYNLKGIEHLYEQDNPNIAIGKKQQNWLPSMVARGIQKARELNIPTNIESFRANLGTIYGEEDNKLLKNPDFQKMYPNFVDVASNVYRDRYNSYNEKPANSISQAKYQIGGVDTDNDPGDTDGDAELEKGEVYQTTEGSLRKIPESGDTHEQGGEDTPNVSRVLEDTSDKRKDRDSKLLKISPQEAFNIVGFKPKSSLSHSKLYEMASDIYDKKLSKMEKQIDKNVDYLDNNGGVAADKSLEFNLKMLKQLPTKMNLFDSIYANQENLKNIHGIGEPQQKYAVGGNALKLPPVGPTYTKSNTVKGGTMPNGESNSFNYPGGLPGYKKDWKPFLNLDDYKTNKEAQSAVYDYLLEHNPDAIREMWKSGNTAHGIKNGTGIKTFTPEYLADINNLKKLKFDYADNNLGARSLAPQKDVPVTTAQTQMPDISIQATKPNVNNDPSADKQYKKPNSIIPSKFNQPLQWYDTIGTFAKFLDASERNPVSFEQLDKHQIQYHELNPEPAIYANQGDFNAAMGQLPTNGIGFANQANLLVNKYKINKDIFAKYAESNQQGYNAVDTANNQAQYQLDSANMGLRDRAVQQQLTAENNQKQAKLAALNNYARILAQNQAFNRNGQLMLQMTPFFDQNGVFNNQKYQIAMGTQVPGQDNNNGKTVQEVTRDENNRIKGTKTITRT